MSPWRTLADEFAQWQVAGQAPTLWWRDDDAVEPSENLTTLFRISEAHTVPLALAVIPETNTLGPDDLSRLTTVFQHGYAHRNHAGAAAKKCELGPERRADHVIGELMTGRDALERVFGQAFLPVLTPPWNRVAGHIRVMLPELGYCGLSQFGARSNPRIGSMHIVNTHVDIIDWKGSRGFVGEEKAIGQLVAHLSQRRQGFADPDEATGLLTHHLVHDDACWSFMERLFDTVGAADSASWLTATDMFSESPPTARPVDSAIGSKGDGAS